MRGLISISELRELVDADEIDTVVAGFTDHYGRLHGKRFDAGFFLDEAQTAGTHACKYLLTVDMEMEPTPGYAYSSWEQGYGDFHMVPDLGTLRVADWLPATAIGTRILGSVPTGVVDPGIPNRQHRRRARFAELIARHGACADVVRPHAAELVANARNKQVRCVGVLEVARDDL